MLKEFFNTLAKVIHLRSIIGYNGLVFALRKTPVIGKIIPDRLYGTAFLKIIYWIIHVIKEVGVLFIGKIFGLGMIYLASFIIKDAYIDYDMAPGVSGSDIHACFALTLFIVYALCGILINIPMFRCTPEKEYLVFMLRMNAKKLDNTLLVYDLAKYAIGYLIAGIVAIVTGCPFWVWLGIPLLAILIKLFGTGVQAISFRIKSRFHKPMKVSAFSLVIRIVCIVIAAPLLLALIANGYYVPLYIVLIACGVLAVLGIWGLKVIMDYEPALHRRALRDNIVKDQHVMYKERDTTKNFKRIKAKGSVKYNKKGFEYLNALFIKRHGAMLVAKPIIVTAVLFVIAGLLAAEFIYGYHQRFGGDNCANMVMHNLLNIVLFRCYEDPLLPFAESTLSLFLRWCAETHLLGLLVPIAIADNSFKSTQAMFINCDNSLMTFSFFKQREKIIKLFDIRLIQLIKINFIPALSFALAANCILFITGGQTYPFQYLATFVISASLSIFCTMIPLASYYLFQPFTTSVNVKSGMYNLVRIIVYSVGAIVIWIPCNSLILAGVLTLLTVFFVFVMRKTVYKYAPKTWRLKA